MKSRETGPRCSRGSSYVEILIAVTLIAIAAYPATNALRGAGATAELGARSTVAYYRLTGRLESVLAEPVTVLEGAAAGAAVPSVYSDAAGTPDRVLIFISAYDIDNADGDNDTSTGVDSGVLLLRGEVEGIDLSLEALKSAP